LNILQAYDVAKFGKPKFFIALVRNSIISSDKKQLQHNHRARVQAVWDPLP
jgi:hypothetical protein